MASLLTAVNAAAQPCTGCNATGAWTPPGNDANFVGANWGYPQIHLALLRGGVVNDVPHHSYLMSWAETNVEQTARGLHGWNPGDPTWNAYPAEAYLKSLGLPDTDVNLFCAGHSTLGDGRILVSGGHVAHDTGIVDARIFDPATRTWTTPPPDTMHFARWYGTNTTLPSGQVLTTSGARFFKSLSFGGSSDLTTASAATDDLRPGQLRVPNIVWEPTTVQSQEWPDPREGHVAAWLGTANRMVVHGGRGADGDCRADTWVMEYWQTGSETYHVGAVEVSGGPGIRCGHAAASNWDGDFMVVYGGKDNDGLISNAVHRYTFGQGWTGGLDQVGPSPDARWGHAVVWDTHNNRMIVFGGRNTTTELADQDVYTMTLDGTPLTATWQKITPAGAAPTKREGHTIVWDNEERSRTNQGSGWQRVVLFGGQDQSGRRDDAWILWYNRNTPNQMEWEQVTDTPAPPARTRHAAFWDFGRNCMVVVGGDTGGANSAQDLWELHVSHEEGSPLEWVQAPDHAPGLAGQTVLRIASEFAAQPERFDPVTGQYSDAYPAILQPSYPPMFVLPSGNLLYPAPNHWTQILNTTGGGAWSTIQTSGDRDFYGDAAVMYLPGKVMKAGRDEPVPGIPLPNRTAKLELTDTDQTSGWQVGQPMSGLTRLHHNLTILPDGKVLVTGGGNSYPEIWDPTSNSWSGYGILNPNPAPRAYHSTVLLLPDGRILTAGGQFVPGVVENSVEQKVTIFSPPYLFDAQGNFAPRPAILEAPCAIGYGASATFEVRTSDIAGMMSGGTAALIRPGSVTHAFDENQRYVPLPFTMCGDRLRLSAPPNANHAPPGDYLLFLVNGSGVPSVAEWVRVGSAPLSGCDRDLVIPSQAMSPVPEIISETEVWMYWNGAADDAPSSGTVTAYEVRRSAQTIADETAFCTSTVADGQAMPATPLEPPGGYQWWHVTGLTPNTLYHFALKARDESWNWGPVSESVSATTLPEWGGGGGLSARPAEGDVVLNAGPSRDGSVAEPLSLTSQPREPLAVELQRSSGRAEWTIRHLGADEAARLAGSDGAAIVLQEPGVDGSWQTRGRLHPGAANTRFGLRSAERSRRYVFFGDVGLDLAAKSVASGNGGDWTLVGARHSRSGDVTAVVRESGGYDLGLDPGETLTLSYEPGSAGEDGASDCFVFVSPAGSSAGLANRGRSRPGAPVNVPVASALHPNHPNPFATRTTIGFDLAVECEVSLELFDAQGRRVRTLAAGRHPAGFHALDWDRRDDAGRQVEAGVYLCRLEAGAFQARRKLVLLP